MSSLRAYLSTSIPEEMDSYLEGLIRGVLKHQPPDINQFAMQYFQSLVDIRKQKGEDKTVHQNVDNYPLIISVKNKNLKRMNNEHSSKQETREISDAKESSLEDTNMTCSEMNSLTRDECFSLQDKSFNSLTFQQSPGHKNIASSLDETDTSFLYTGRNKDGFSSLDQPATSFSGPESDVKVESQSEIHTELESSSNSTLEICQSRKDQISEKDMGTPTVSPDFENVLNRQESGKQEVDGDLPKESDSVQDASLKVSQEHISSGQSEECPKTEISKLGNELKSEDVQIHENSDINVENNAVEANTSSNEQFESPQQIAEEIVIDENQKDVETSPGTEHTPKELSKEKFDNTADTAHNNIEAIHVSATESDKIETKAVLEEGIIDKTDGLETNQKESVETFPETEKTLNEISKETFDTTDDTTGNNTSVFKSDEEKNLERSEEHDKITSEETLDKENIRPITESSDVVNENIETFEEDPLSIIQESENLKPTEADGLEANQKECAETSSHDKDNLEAMVKFSDAISPVSTPPKGENLETSIKSPGLDKMDSAAESADTVQNEANQMEKVDAEDAISVNVEEIPTNSEALGVVETPEGNVKICPEIIVQDEALVFDDEAVLEENLGPDTKDSNETISELVEGNDESSGKDNGPISSEHFLKVPEVTLEDGLVAKEKKAEEITEEVDATSEYNEDHSKKAEKMNTIEEVFQEDHEGNEVASEEPIDVDTESGNEKTPKDDNGEHEIRIIRSTDDLNAQVETLLEEEILEIAEPIQEVSEDDGKDASNDKGEETSKPILDEEISTGEISSDLDDTKETVNEMGLKDDTVDHDNTKDLDIGEKQKSIDFNEVLGQVNEADLKVVEIEELKHIDDIISSADKVDSLNLDSSQSDSNATLTSDKTEKSSGITLTTDINEKFADTEINEDIEDSLPVKLAAPVMISKVIEIKQLDEISDEESLQHVQASDVTSIEEEDLLRSVNIGGVPLPKQELPFAPIIITTVVKAKVRDNSDEHIPEPSQAEEELDRLSNVSADTTGEVVDETQMLSPKLEESDNQDVLSNEESLSEAKSTVDQSLLEEHEIFEILTSVDLTEEKAESISGM
ncbi:hypothetical protein M8J75_012277 [Diaphorina citri]|nr:hypothetical protein M8J75_012277 [Diaphorina citri]